MTTNCLPIALSKAMNISYGKAEAYCGYVEGLFTWPFKLLIRLINERKEVCVIDDMDLRDTPLESAISSFKQVFEEDGLFTKSNVEEAIKDSKLIDWSKVAFIARKPVDLDIMWLLEGGYSIIGMVDVGPHIYHFEHITEVKPCIYLIAFK